SAKGDDKFITTDYLQQCQKSWLHATGERSLQTQLVEYKKQTAKFTFLAMACRLCSHLFTLFWVNKKENIYDANHYIYKLECIL
ncbi:hypothetical protein H8F57_25875, partial [Klebsiella pneumoniae]|nr:hypothetical protein [Klebsiella pneumoniae]